MCDHTSDAGVLSLGTTGRTTGLVDRCADGFVDGVAPAAVERTVEAVLAQRVLTIARGQEDPVDRCSQPVAGKLTAQRQK